MALRRKAELETVAQEVTPTPDPVVEKAVVVQQPRAVAPVRKPTQIVGQVFDDKQGLFVAEFGTIPRLRATNGNIFDDKDRNLGEWVDIKIESWNHVYAVGPCDNNAPKELVRYTLDKETFDDGSMESVAEYVADLRAAGHKKAAVAHRAEIVGVLLNAAKPSENTGKLVLLSLAPTSAKAFRGFQLTTSFQISSGALSLDDVLAATRFTVEVVTQDNTWSKFVPSVV